MEIRWNNCEKAVGEAWGEREALVFRQIEAIPKMIRLGAISCREFGGFEARAFQPVVERLASQGWKNDGVRSEFVGTSFHRMGHEPGEKKTSAPEVSRALGLRNEFLNRSNLENEKCGSQIARVRSRGLDRTHNRAMVPYRGIGNARVRRQVSEIACIVVLTTVVSDRVVKPKPP